MTKMETTKTKCLKMDVINYYGEPDNEPRVKVLLDVAKRDAKKKACELNRVIVTDSMEEYEEEMDRSFSDESVDYVILFNVDEMDKSVIQMCRE